MVIFRAPGGGRSGVKDLWQAQEGFGWGALCEAMGGQRSSFVTTDTVADTEVCFISQLAQRIMFMFWANKPRNLHLFYVWNCLCACFMYCDAKDEEHSISKFQFKILKWEVIHNFIKYMVFHQRSAQQICSLMDQGTKVRGFKATWDQTLGPPAAMGRWKESEGKFCHHLSIEPLAAPFNIHTNVGLCTFCH